MISSAYLRLLIFLLAILFQFVLPPAQHFAWCALHISQIAGWQYTALTYSFSNLEPVHCSVSGSNCCFLICIQISQEAGQVVCSSHLLKNFPQFAVVHTVKGFGIVNKAEVDAFLELSCFFYDPTSVDNLISGSSAFSKSSLNIWKFMVQVLLKPGLENFWALLY